MVSRLWIQLTIIGLFAVVGTSSGRRTRTLTGTSFPFGAGHNHHHHELPHPISRQGSDELPNLEEIANAGERCVQKVMMVEETIYDNEIICHHSYQEKCFNTQKTDFEAFQEEVCEDRYTKTCEIKMFKRLEEFQVEICSEQPVRDCTTPGPVVCKEMAASQCRTEFHVHEVEQDEPRCTTTMMKKCRDVTVGYTTENKCEEWPVQNCTIEKVTVKNTAPNSKCERNTMEVCGPDPCPITVKRSCRNDTDQVVSEEPKEECRFDVEQDCHFVTKLLPVLKDVQECVDVPKEVCVRAKVNPRKNKKPVIKKWCYTPTNAGSEDENNDNKVDEEDNLDSEGSGDDISQRG